MYTVGFQSIEIAKKVFVTFDTVFQIYLMSGLKKNEKKKRFPCVYPFLPSWGCSMTTWTQFSSILTTTCLYVEIFNPKHLQKQRFFTTYRLLLSRQSLNAPPLEEITPLINEQILNFQPKMQPQRRRSRIPPIDSSQQRLPLWC